METALGMTLKTLTKRRKNQKTIRVCDDCGIPLIWTFAFDYKERYCLNCGLSGGMFGTGTDKPATRELVFKQKLVNAVWKIIYGKKGLVPKSSQRCNCKKCDNSSEVHYQHLTKSEKEWDIIAREHLDIVQGFLSESNLKEL